VIVTWQVTLRIALLILVAALLQFSFLSQLSLLGASPDLVTVLVVCLGLLGGAVVGAVCGFATGLLTDTMLLQTLGVSSLVLLTVGFLAGRYREGFEITSALTPLLLAGALTLLGATMFAIVQLMLGVESPVSLLIMREIVVKGLLGVLLAIPVYPVVRRVLRPALIEDAPRRRRSLLASTPLNPAS
jgi:rod shape-determining protein MreD